MHVERWKLIDTDAFFWPNTEKPLEPRDGNCPCSHVDVAVHTENDASASCTWKHTTDLLRESHKNL